MSADAPPPTGMIPRFARLIEAMKRAVADGADRRRLLGPLGKLGPLAGLLWQYLGHTRRRLAALHARYAAGRLPAAPRRPATPRPAADRPGSARRPPGIPRGPVFLQYGLGCFVLELRELVEDPEMRALLAASPQAGRLLRPLWRKLTTDPLPEVLQPAVRSRASRRQPRLGAGRRRRVPLRPRAQQRRPTRRAGDARPLRPSRRLRCPPGLRRFGRTDAAPSSHAHNVANMQHNAAQFTRPSTSSSIEPAEAGGRDARTDPQTHCSRRVLPAGWRLRRARVPAPSRPPSASASSPTSTAPTPTGPARARSTRRRWPPRISCGRIPAGPST